jgi:hypothetical protein
MVEIARVLAGRETNLTVAVSASLSLSLVTSGTALAYLLKSRRQSAELRRQRERIEALEAKIREMEGAISQPRLRGRKNGP